MPANPIAAFARSTVILFALASTICSAAWPFGQLNDVGGSATTSTPTPAVPTVGTLTAAAAAEMADAAEIA